MKKILLECEVEDQMIVQCTPLKPSDIDLDFIEDREDREWYKKFFGFVVSSKIHTFLIFIQILAGYLFYGTANFTIRYVAFFYLCFVMMILMTIPFAGIPMVAIGFILWEVAYNLLLEWCGLGHTSLTISVYWIFVCAGCIFYGIITKIFWNLKKGIDEKIEDMEQTIEDHAD